MKGSLGLHKLHGNTWYNPGSPYNPPRRVISYWNKLPSDVKNSDSVDGFKINLEKFKVNSISKNVNSNGQFWEVSRDVLQRIEGPSYLENKLVHNEFLKLNPFVAKKKFINIY